MLLRRNSQWHDEKYDRTVSTFLENFLTKRVRATIENDARNMVEHVSRNRWNRVFEKDRRGQADEVSSRLVRHRSEIELVVCRVGELFRKQARPSPSSNGRESISEPLFEKEELLPSTGPMFHIKTYRS